MIFTYSITFFEMQPYEEPRKIVTMTGAVTADTHAQAEKKAQALAFAQGRQLEAERGIIVGYGQLRVALQQEAQEQSTVTPDAYQ